MASKLRIERKASGSTVWLTVGYPKDNMEEALELLACLKILENDKRYKGELRLVSIIREVLAT